MHEVGYGKSTAAVGDVSQRMGKIRILHVAATSTGGVGLNILLLGRYLNRERFETSVAMALGSPLDRDLIQAGVKIYPIKMSRSPKHPKNALGLYQLWRLLGSEKFDIVHTHTSVGGLLGRVAAKSRGIAVVLWSIHGWAFNYPMGWIAQSCFRFIEKFLDIFTDHYVAVSHNMKEVGIRGGVTRPEKVTVIHHGIELEKYVSNDSARGVRERLGITGDLTVVGCIGRFEPQKAIDDFLRAAKIVKNIFPRVRFLLVGDGFLRGELKSLVRQLGIEADVVFTGWQQDIKPFVEAMDVVCIPSLWEALPFLHVEVMALGRPIVATRVGGVPEVVEDRKTGLLVPPSDPQALADGVIHLLSDREWAQVMGSAGRERVRRCFSVGEMIQQYESLYLGLCEGR